MISIANVNVNVDLKGFMVSSIESSLITKYLKEFKVIKSLQFLLGISRNFDFKNLPDLTFHAALKMILSRKAFSIWS